MTATVIIIVKDTHDFLPKCLDSVKSQTLKDIEVIVVDDHSVMKSEDIVESYKKQLAVSYLYLDEEYGPGGARNRGIEHAHGDYICFLDSDDWIDLGYLEKAIEKMVTLQADIGMCGLVRNYDSVAYKPLYKCKYERVNVLDGITAFKMLSGQFDFGVTISPSPVNKLYRKAFLLKYGIRFLEHVYYEDVLFAFQTLLTGCKIITIPNTFYHHYRRIGSIVQSLSKRHFDDFETVFLSVRQYLIEVGIYNEYGKNYYKVLERFYNLLIRQVFQFAKTDLEKKYWMKYSFDALKKVIVFDEYFEYYSAEDIRRHLQPFIEDTSLL